MSRTSVGGLIGESGYTSASSAIRYNNIPYIINSNIIPGLDKQKLDGKIRIRECACGRGQAIAGLIERLSSEWDIELDLFDILDPRTLLNQEKLQSLSKDSKLRSITSHSVTEAYELEADISIMGYVLPYLAPEDLKLAIRNILESSKLLVIVPGDASAQSEGELSTLYIWKGETGFNYKYTYTPISQ